MGVALAIRADAPPSEIGLATTDLTPNPDLHWLRGRTTVHKILIGLRDPQGCLGSLMDELGRSGGDIRALTLNPTQPGCFEVVLQAANLSPHSARSMVERMAAHPAILSAVIEHVLIR